LTQGSKTNTYLKSLEGSEPFTDQFPMAAIEQETGNLDNREIKDMDTKEIQADQTAYLQTEASQSKKRVILERLILCVALFFPLFLATLDTSDSPL
jgi:hypothetical protein